MTDIRGEIEAALSCAKGLTFDEEKHEYRHEGVIVPSVTQVLKVLPHSTSPQWTEADAWRGTAVHRACELDDKGDLDEAALDPRLKGYLEAWRAFQRGTRLSIIANEARVYQPTLRYAGKVDRIMIADAPGDDNNCYVVDIKSGSPHPTHGPQLAGYALCIKRSMRRIGVYLKEDWTYKVVEYDKENDFKVFMAALTCYRWEEFV